MPRKENTQIKKPRSKLQTGGFPPAIIPIIAGIATLATKLLAPSAEKAGDKLKTKLFGNGAKLPRGGALRVAGPSKKKK